MIRKIAVMASILGGMCALAAFGLAYTYAATRERIAKQIWESQVAAARAVLPAVRSNEDFTERKDLADEARRTFPVVDKVFEGKGESGPAGWAVQVLPRGYGGPITLMVGVAPDGTSTGISVVEHKETPGLGTGIMEAAFADQFKGRKAGDPLRPNKDFDALSGATISSKAVAAGVRGALEAIAAAGGGQP